MNKSQTKQFSQRWKDKGSEKQHAQQFLSDFTQNVLGVNPLCIEFEKRSENPSHGFSFIDAYIDLGENLKILIEMKSRGTDLAKKIPRNNGARLTPFEQALNYNFQLPKKEMADWIITCNFEEFWIYDLNRTGKERYVPVAKVKLENLDENLDALTMFKVGEVERDSIISEPDQHLFEMLNPPLETAKVKYAAPFTLLDLSNFSVVERRLLMILLHKAADSGNNQKIQLTRSDLYQLGMYFSGTKVTLSVLKEEVISTLKKCKTLRFHTLEKLDPDSGSCSSYESFSLFKTIECDFTGEWLIRFSLSNDVIPYLNHSLKDGCSFYLKDFQKLNTKYQQDLFRLLVHLQHEGCWRVSKENFIKLMNIPQSYRQSDIDRSILNPAIEKLSSLFVDLKCQKYPIRGAVGSRIGIYEFSWKSVSFDLKDES